MSEQTNPDEPSRPGEETTAFAGNEMPPPPEQQPWGQGAQREPPPSYQPPTYQPPTYGTPQQPPGYPEPSYGQPQSGQPLYGQQPYGQQGYQQLAYQQHLQYSQQPGYAQPSQSEPKRGRRLTLWLGVAGVIVAAAVVVGILGWATGPKFFVTTNLSHTAVEQYIEGKNAAQQYPRPDRNVTCNGGSDIEIEPGAVFSCNGDRASYTVTIQNDNADYTVEAD